MTRRVNHTFTDWEEFNLMIGVGGWGGRDERHGPYVKYKDGEMVFDYSPGHAGECVDAHEYAVVTRERNHPIMRGLPPIWLHGTDDLYRNQRGPARNMTILATAYSDPAREAHWGGPDPRYGRSRADGLHDSLRRGPGVRHCDGPRGRRRAGGVGTVAGHRLRPS